jgi:hypothetical protein
MKLIPVPSTDSNKTHYVNLNHVEGISVGTEFKAGELSDIIAGNSKPAQKQIVITLRMASGAIEALRYSEEEGNRILSSHFELPPVNLG